MVSSSGKVKRMARTYVFRGPLVAAGCTVLVLLAMALWGGSEMATVEGMVTVDGQPVTAGRVVFRSADGKSTILANIAPDGSYRALDVPYVPMQVTVAGLTKMERVRVQRGVKGKKSAESEARNKAVESSPKVPEKYEDPDTSGLSFTATSGTNTYNIEIRSERN